MPQRLWFSEGWLTSRSRGFLASNGSTRAVRIAGGLAACAVLGIAAALSSSVMLFDWPGATGLFGTHNDFSTEWLGAFLTGIASVLGFGAVARNCFGAPTWLAIILAPIGFALSDLVAMWLVITLGWG